MEPDPNSFHRITLQLPVPVQDSKTLLKLLQLELQAHPPKAPVKKVLLSIEAASPRKVQGELFIPPGPEPQRMEITLARIKAIAGETRVGSPVLRNTHRPDAFQMQRFLPSEALGARTPRPLLATEAIRRKMPKPRSRQDTHPPRNTVPLFRIQPYGAFGLRYLHV